VISLVLALIVLIGGSVPKILKTKGFFPIGPAFQFPAQATQTAVSSRAAALFSPAAQPCDIQSADYCIVDGNFIFKQPVDPAFTHLISGNYRYGLTDNGKREPHHGVDFPAEAGTPVLAAADGVVVFAGSEKTGIYSPRGNFYGYFILIQHPNELYTLYAHLSKIAVSVSQQVQVGEVIGAVGRSGIAIGPHLHFEVRQGGDGKDYFSTQNPELWLELSKDPEGTLPGVLSVTIDADMAYKALRPVVLEHYPFGATSPDRVIYSDTYPFGFENNLEDAVFSNLQPGRYRVAVNDHGEARDQWVSIESGKLTQVYMVPP
jgi:Peptidase family M23